MGVRIVVDLLAFTGARGGTETYAHEIVTRIPAHLPNAEFVALANGVAADRIRAFFPGDVRELSWVKGDRISWALGEVLAVNRAARRARGDLIWCPANFGPLNRSVPRVMTAHDVISHEAGGSLSTRSLAAVTAWLMARATRTADAVISGSDAAATAIETHIGVAAASVTVIPHGTNDPHPPTDPWRELESLGITQGRRIVLSTGNRLPHKNFEGLIRGLATIEPALRPLTVITGGGRSDPLAPLVDELHLASDVVLPGWVSTDQLESLYAVADLYVCPSLVEGFGLPVIDAMRRSCVVLANDVPVLREVGGTAALYVDATSPAVLGAGIQRALASGPDAARREAGRRWASRFTWDESARRTAEVLAATLQKAEVRRG